MPRAAAIILNNNHVALIKRLREGRLYYVFPGGQIEPGESPEQAAVREVEEELGLQVKADRLIANINFRGREQFFFLSQVTGGQFGTGLGPEMQGLYPPERGSYRAVWMPVASLLKENVLPRAMAEIILVSARHGWPANPIHLEET